MKCKCWTFAFLRGRKWEEELLHFFLRASFCSFFVCPQTPQSTSFMSSENPNMQPDMITQVFVVPVLQSIEWKCDGFPVPFGFGFAGWIPQSALLPRARTVLYYPQRQRPPVWASRTQPESHLLEVDCDFQVNTVCQRIKHQSHFTSLWMFPACE